MTTSDRTSLRRQLIAAVFATLCGLLTNAPPAHAAEMADAIVARPADARETARLHRLFEDYWNWRLTDDPALATYLGDARYDDRIYDISAGAYRRRFEKARHFLRRADGFRAGRLSAVDQLSLAILQRRLRLALRGEALHSWLEDSYLLPLNQMEGLHHRVLTLPATHPFASERDYENYLRRLRAVPVQIDHAIANMRTGIRLGVIMPKIVVDRVIQQLGVAGEANVDAHPLSEPLSRFPSGIGGRDRARLKAATERQISSAVAPAFLKLHRFMVEEYLPKAPAAVTLPGGPALRDYLIEVNTTTTMSAGEIHDLGLAALETAVTERAEFVRGLGFGGTPVEFNQRLQTDMSLRLVEPAAVEAEIRASLSVIEKRLPELFLEVPPVSAALRQVEAYRAKSFPMGAFFPGSIDGKRPGTFYYNMVDGGAAGVRRFALPNLAFHESLPGHQFQSSYSRLNRGLPSFRRFGGNSAYNEGWATYAERLADEVGAYPDANARNFYLSAQVWAYVSVVAQTGFYAKGWTPEETHAFMRRYLPTSEERFQLFLSRSISLPAQGLGYSVGALTIQRLRERSERELGKRFDKRAFHDVVLRDGGVPMDVLTELVEKWIAEQKR
jgi:uncharacterized protein (DUF885 family)